MKKERIFFAILILFLIGFVFAEAQEIEIIITEKKIQDTAGGRRSLGVASIESIKKVETLEDVEIKHRYSTFDGAVIEVTREKFEELKLEGKYNVREARKFYVSLNQSVPQIDADNVWNLTLGDNYVNGTGQTVCVIDTGVSWNHTAFGGCYGNNNASSNCTVIGGYDFVNGDSDPIDDEGHGTHVAGIIASRNNTYKGVAPGAKIIAIKALDDGGSGYDTDIIAGIDWCVSNATTFNISVITMSLSDCTNWSTSCDSSSSYNDSWVPAVNAAAALNITIVAAAGNGPFGGCSGQPITTTGGPAAPACLSNITPVGGVNSSDRPFDNWQRGNLFQLFAPGYLITSTTYDGSFGLNSGTSMATPHVAGAAAIMNQMYKFQRNRLPSLTEFRNLMNTTGFIINDTAGTNRNYSRINVSSAIFSIDETGPIITLNSPSNSMESLESNHTFNCSATDFALANLTLFVWNSTNQVYSNQSVNLSGNYNSSTFNLSNISVGNYTWNCRGTDILSNSGFSTTNYSFEIKNVLVNLTSPINNYQTSNEANSFSCSTNTSTTKEFSNLTFYLWNSSNYLLYNSTQNISEDYNSSSFSYNLTSDGNYTWNCKGINNQSESSFAINNYTIKIDGTAPAISSVSSDPTSSTIAVTWTTDELSNSSISGDMSGSSSSLVTSHSLTISGLDSSTEYDYVIRSCDNVGNCASSTHSETTEEASSGGGGGGGSSTTTSSVLNTQLEDNYVSLGQEISFEENEKLIFNLSKENHTITLIEINNDSVNISIESEVIYLLLKEGEEKKINLTSSEYFDLLIKLLELNSSEATIYLEEINESIFEEGNAELDKKDSSVNNLSNQVKGNAIYISLSILGFFVLIYLSYLIVKKRKKLKQAHHHKHVPHHERKEKKDKTKS